MLEIGAIVLVGCLLAWVIIVTVLGERCRQCGSHWWQQEVVSNPVLSPMAPFLRHCKRCGFTEPEMP